MTPRAEHPALVPLGSFAGLIAVLAVHGVLERPPQPALVVQLVQPAFEPAQLGRAAHRNPRWAGLKWLHAASKRRARSASGRSSAPAWASSRRRAPSTN